MKPYTITRTPTGFQARWKDVIIEANTAHEAINAIMRVIKIVTLNNNKTQCQS